LNGIEVRRRIKIRGANEFPTLVDERVPSHEELRKVFLASDDKARDVCVLMAHSGLRPEVLGNYEGNEGLRVNDLPEMTIEHGTVTFEEIPTLVRFRPGLNKTAPVFQFSWQRGL